MGPISLRSPRSRGTLAACRSFQARLAAALSMLAFALALTGCAVGNKYDYRRVVLTEPWIRGAGTLAVAVHDLRPDVVKGEETPDYVGMQRGGFGNPFDVSTESGNPLADDWAHAVAKGLSFGGFAAAPVATSFLDRPEVVIRKLQATGAQALLLFVLREWHSDTFTNVTLHHEVALDVLSPAGQVLAEARLTGSSELGGDALNPPAYAKENVPREFQNKLGLLLRDARITQAVLALTGSPPR